MEIIRYVSKATQRRILENEDSWVMIMQLAFTRRWTNKYIPEEDWATIPIKITIPDIPIKDNKKY